MNLVRRAGHLALMALAVAACSVGAVEGEVPLEKIDFHQALQRALSRNPDYDSAVRTKNLATVARRNAVSSLLPSVDATAERTYTLHGNSTAPAVHEPWAETFGLTVTENLYDNGVGWRNLESSQLNEQAAELTLERARQSLMLKVTKAFFDYSAATGTLGLQRLQYELIRRQFQSIESRYRGGISSNRDYLRIKSQLQRAELSLTSQKVAVEEAKANLALAIGETSEVEFEPVIPKNSKLDGLKFPKVPAEETLDHRISKLQAKVSELKYQAVRREDWPRLAVTGTYNYNIPQFLSSKVPGSDDPNWDFQALLTLQYTIWDWGIRRRNVEAADSQMHIEFDAQESQRQQTSQALNKLDSQIELIKQSYAQTKAILRDDENVFESLNGGYRDGKVTYLELITALGDLFGSRSQLLTLQFNLLKSRADLAYYQGNLDEVFKDF